MYTPGLVTTTEIGRVVREVDRPVNVLALPGVPPVAELAGLGVARVSVGGAFSLVALAAVAGAGHDLLETSAYGYWDAIARAGDLRRAFD